MFGSASGPEKDSDRSKELILPKTSLMKFLLWGITKNVKFLFKEGENGIKT